MKETTKSLPESFVTQKNYLLLEKLLEPANGNITEAAIQYVNFCDASFDDFLSEKITSTDDEEGKQVLGRVRYEINLARKGKLIEADKILRGILSAGGLKQMEAKLTYHLRKSEIDMAFMVILQLNIADAIDGNATTAVQVMTHLETMITEYQDSLVSAPVRLLRLLVRTDDTNVRKQMLRQKLLIGSNILADSQQSDVTLIEAQDSSIVSSSSNSESCSTPDNDCCGGSDSMSDDHSHDHDHSHAESIPVAKSAEPLSTSSPQCEFIVVEPVKVWGGADVVVADLEATIDDILQQMSTDGTNGISDLESKCAVLRKEIREVIEEVDAPKVNDIPDNCENSPNKF